MHIIIMPPQHIMQGMPAFIMPIMRSHISVKAAMVMPPIGIILHIMPSAVISQVIDAIIIGIGIMPPIIGFIMPPIICGIMPPIIIGFIIPPIIMGFIIGFIMPGIICGIMAPIMGMAAAVFMVSVPVGLVADRGGPRCI